MPNKVVYEWDIETIDENEDIMDHNHADKLDRHDKLKENERLVLVRDEFSSYDEDLESRTWAYVENGKLPEYFKDSANIQTTKVPVRFHKELEKWTTKNN